jgi:phosphate-selective porin OprO/OprP
MTMGKMGLLGSAGAMALMLTANAANAQTAAPSNAELAAQIQALQNAMDARDERLQSDRTRLSTLEQGYNSAVWSFDNGRPVFATGDGRFTMGFRLRFQSDFAGFSQDSTHPAGFAGPVDLSSGAVVRRAYFGVEGKVYNDFAYEIRLNGGGSDGGNNPTCTNPTVTSTTTIAGAPGATATTASTAAGCAIGSIEPAGEGDPLVNKAVVTYTGIPFWHLNVGVIEPSFMMEGTTSSKDLTWLERPEIENIAADSFGAGDSRRGIELGWSKTDVLWPGDNMAFDAAFTGGKTGSAAGHGNGGDEQSQILGRVADRLWSDGISNFQIGGSAARVLYSGNAAGGGSQTLRFRDRPEIRVDGTRLIDTGGIAAKSGNMFAADFEGNLQNFYLEGEYTHFSMDRQCGAIIVANNARCNTTTAVIDHPQFSGWTVGGSWILTGENKTYTPSGIGETQAGFGAPVPSRPFSFSGDSWGTWEIAARYSDTNLNWNVNQVANGGELAGILGGDQRIVDLALNWYLNRNERLMIDDNIVNVHKGTAALPNRDGQSFNVVGVRLQFAN